MRYIFICMFFLFFVVNILAQEGFSRIYQMEVGESDRLQQIIRVEDQLILIIFSDCDLFDGDRCLNIISTDLAGEELWRIERGAHQIEDEMDIAALSNNHIYVATQDLTTATGGQQGQMQVLEIDLSGNVVETHIMFFSVPEGFSFRGLIANGNQFIASSYINQENGPTLLRLTSFDSDFNWMGQKVFSSDQTPMGIQDIIPTNDGGYILAFISNISSPTEQRKVQQFTPDGTLEWERILTTSEFINHTSIATNESGDVFILYMVNQNFFTDPEQFLYVEKLDNEGNVIWVNNHYIPGEEIRIYERMFLTAADEMICVGAGEAMGPDNGFYGMVAKIGSEGELEWEKAFRDTDLGGMTTLLYNGAALENGDLVFGGELVNTIPALYQDPWLLRTSADGCVYTESCGDINLVTPTQDLTEEVEAFYLSPVLAHDQLTIYQKGETTSRPFRIRMVSATGQLIRERTFNRFPYQMQVAKYPPGIYFLQIMSTNGIEITLKFVKK